jgi:transcriptional repressor NrdR
MDQTPDLAVLLRLPPSAFPLSPLKWSCGFYPPECSVRAMKCPYCLLDDDRVLDSRASQDGLAIRRRRECLGCKRRYTTYERIEATTVKIVKKDGSREPFDHAKIKRGLEKACWKRPIGDDQLETIIAAVENDIESNFESEVDSRHVGELVMQHLRDLDEVAYVRFASVYRQFKDVRDFVEELRPMLTGGRRTE